MSITKTYDLPIWLCLATLCLLSVNGLAQNPFINKDSARKHARPVIFFRDIPAQMERKGCYQSFSREKEYLKIPSIENGYDSLQIRKEIGQRRLSFWLQ